MTLRSRLLLALVGLVALALVVADVVTYTQLRSFLVARLDPQLRVASFAMAGQVESADHVRPPHFFGPTSGEHPPVSPPRSHFPAGGNQLPRDLRGFRPPGGGIEPGGTFGELINGRGARVGKVETVFSSGKPLSTPRFTNRPPPIGPSGYVEFDASSTGTGAASYRILERSLHYHDLRVVVGIPLSDVDDTLNRLLWVELLVSGAALGALTLLSWWTVRRGLRPLEDMARSAGEIARGQLGRRVAPAEDRTEVGRLGLALNAMLSEIEEAFAARAASEDRLRRFLADASHELRTPLTSIRGYAELFELGAKERPTDLATSLRHIREEADRMGVLVDDLLLLARLDRERPLDLRPTDIVPVISRTVEVARHVSPGPQIDLEAPPSQIIACDPARIRQVLDNLLTNALRHSPPDQPVEVALRPSGNSVVLSVRDHGPGVPDIDAERIFAPFHRSDFARSRSHGGAGLGLAIVAAITRAHQGTVGVRQAEGGGAEFWVELPTATSVDPTSLDAGGSPSSGSQQVTQRTNTGASV